jgi:hypothetical protein
MAVFRYMSEADTDQTPLSNDNIKAISGGLLDVTKVLRLFLEYMTKYPELLEFANGVQNIVTLFN